MIKLIDLKKKLLSKTIFFLGGFKLAAAERLLGKDFFRLWWKHLNASECNDIENKTF
jgi:hypothetical protein